MGDSSDGPSRRRAPRTSEILRDFAAASGESILVRDILVALGERAHGAVLFVFAIPNIVPLPVPGASAVLGLPLVLFSAQLALGHARPWAPRALQDRAIARADFDAMLARALPWIEKGERLLRPRLQFLTSPAAERAIGMLCLVLAVVLVLPIPLGNIFPAFCIAVLALGVAERDGAAVIAGTVLAAFSLVVVAAVVAAMVQAFLFFLSHALM